MTTSVHANLTGSDLHEPKGAATALSGEVYVSDGAGSGVWTPASSVVTNTAFTTGDLKPTHKATADTSWIMWVDGTIGDGSSGASLRANADTVNLFTLYWGYSNCTIAGGKGISAASDFAAHKSITIPVGSGRAIANANGNVTSVAGASTQTLITANLPPYTPAGTVSVTSTSNFIVTNTQGFGSAPGGGSQGTFAQTTGVAAAAQTSTGSLTGSAQGGTSTPFSILPLTSYVNFMIKL